jgi:hypothetical protein
LRSAGRGAAIRSLRRRDDRWVFGIMAAMSQSRRSASAPEEAAHDVLAAEAFAMPAPDPTLHHGPVVLPEDPTGIAEPHDVLAAEEFPMPAPREPRAGPSVRPEKASHQVGLAAAAGLLLLSARRLLRGR